MDQKNPLFFKTMTDWDRAVGAEIALKDLLRYVSEDPLSGGEHHVAAPRD